MKVTLIAYTQPVGGGGNPLSIVEQAACVCYDSKPTKTYRIAKSCMVSGHRSVFEHISFTFHIEGVTRALLAQLTRHRHMSPSVRSQRYCVEDIVHSSVEPESIKNNGLTERVFSDTIGTIAEAYKIFTANGIEIEDARSVLPNACITELYLTANARALIESSWLRLCTRAQKEIRGMYRRIKSEVATVSPEIAEYMLPKCQAIKEYPFCTERNCCGLAPKLADVYKGWLEYKEKG